MAEITLPLPFEHVAVWIHEAWVGLQSAERMLSPISGETDVNDPVLRLARTVVIHCLEQGMIALNGLQEELIGRGDFGEDKKT